MDFIYTDNQEDYTYVLETRISECRCKHVLSVENPKAVRVKELSEKIGYEAVQWGTHENLTEDMEVCRQVQLFRIQRMIYKDIKNAMRVVIGKKNDIWIDNLHTSIAAIITNGSDVKIKDIKCYIVDMGASIPVVCDINGSVRKNVMDIQGAVRASEARLSRVSTELLELNYTIGDFIKENRLTREHMTIFHQ